MICREKIETFCPKLFNTGKNCVDRDTFESLAKEFHDLQKYTNTVLNRCDHNKDNRGEEVGNRFSNYEGTIHNLESRK